VSALARTGESVGYTLDLLEAVQLVNERQKRVLIEKIERHYKGDLRGKTFAVWGLAFKPNTDDMRDAPSRVIIEGLWRGGAHVRAFDPVATQEAHRIYGDRDNLTLCNSKESAAEGADALVLVTEWMDFRSPDFQWLRGALKEPVVFDGRNLFDPDQMAEEGFTYYGIGSGTNSR
jgi:UDPglucose 6-dehydrogenase